MECPTHTSHQVEYLLLECLQDLTGGFSAFFLASYSLMVDITTDQTRTRRLSFLDAFWEIGVLIGVPLGTYMKSQHGYIAVFSVAACVIFSCILLRFELREKVRLRLNKIILGGRGSFPQRLPKVERHHHPHGRHVLHHHQPCGHRSALPVVGSVPRLHTQHALEQHHHHITLQHVEAHGV